MLTAVLTGPVLVGALRLLPGRELPPRCGWRELDLLGGVLLGATSALALTGITEAARTGFTAVTAWGSLVASALLGVGFVLRIRRAGRPFVPPALFTNAIFVAAVAVSFLTLFAYLAAEVLAPLLVTSVNRLDAAQTGLVLLPGALAAVLISVSAGRWSDSLGPRLPVLAGLAAMAVSTLTLSTLAGHSALIIAAGMLGVSLGFAVASVAVLNAAATALPAEHTGIGLGIYQGAFYLGGGAGAAISAALLTGQNDTLIAWNPLHVGGASPFSNAFLLALPALTLAALLASRLSRSGTSAGGERYQLSGRRGGGHSLDESGKLLTRLAHQRPGPRLANNMGVRQSV